MSNHTIQRLDDLEITLTEVNTKLAMLLRRMDVAEIQRARVCRATKKAWLAELDDLGAYKPDPLGAWLRERSGLTATA